MLEYLISSTWSLKLCVIVMQTVSEGKSIFHDFTLLGGFQVKFLTFKCGNVEWEFAIAKNFPLMILTIE